MPSDKQLIESIGGAAKLASILGYTKHGGVQRVHNWMSRGIPSKVKLEHPEIFLRPSGTKPNDLEADSRKTA